MKKVLYVFLGLLGIGTITYALGPTQDYPEFTSDIQPLQISLEELESYLANKEAKVENLKSNNQSQIIWADSIRKTPFSVVYLHGFSASPMEGDPVHFDFAKRYGCNLYLPRISGHGISDDDAFAELTPKDMIDSAKEAIAIGQLLGDKVIVMSTSTGGTLSVYLSAMNPEAIHAQILFSPNIELFSKIADLLTYPWGLEIAQMVEDEYRHLDHLKGEVRNYWTTTYRMEGAVALKYLMEATMTDETFQKVKHPIYLGCYYKNEEVQDNIVSVSAMRDFYAKVGTPDQFKRMEEFPDAGHHVMISRFHSKTIPDVEKSVFSFAEEVLGLQPIRTQ